MDAQTHICTGSKFGCTCPPPSVRSLTLKCHGVTQGPHTTDEAHRVHHFASSPHPYHPRHASQGVSGTVDKVHANPTSNPTKLYRSQRPLTRWNHVIRPRITQNHGKMHGIEVETDWNTLNPNPNPPVPSVPACTTLESVYRPCTEGHGVFTLSTVTLTRTTTPTHPSLRTVTLTFTLRQATLRQSPLTVRAMCS
jgi:hypothetical protein